MGDIAQRGNKLTRRIGKFGGGRTNLLEELGRVEGERSNPNRRAEISRVHGELNRGYKDGGKAGKYQETYRQPQLKKSDLQEFSRKRKEERADKYKNPKRKFPPEKPTWSDMPRKPLEKSKMQPLKKGGKADKNWMQKVSASIKKRGTKGKCTPITKPGCTGRAKALAKTFKKIAAKRKKS
jgi:hypothetical protein